MSTILEIKNVTKTFGDEIIFKNVNLTVKKGEVISVIGKSGSGKSTFLKCLKNLSDAHQQNLRMKTTNKKAYLSAFLNIIKLKFN